MTPDDAQLVLTQVGKTFGDPNGSTLMRLDLSAPPAARKLEPLFSQNEGANVARLSPNGRSLIVGRSGNIYACRYPPAGDSLRLVAALAGPAWPFFSRDGQLLYVVSRQALYAHAVEASSDGRIRVGERSQLFRILHPARADANLGAASRDGKRILAIATDDTEETLLQVLTDWTTLLRP